MSPEASGPTPYDRRWEQKKVTSLYQGEQDALALVIVRMAVQAYHSAPGESDPWYIRHSYIRGDDTRKIEIVDVTDETYFGPVTDAIRNHIRYQQSFVTRNEALSATTPPPEEIPYSDPWSDRDNVAEEL